MNQATHPTVQRSLAHWSNSTLLSRRLTSNLEDHPLSTVW